MKFSTASPKECSFILAGAQPDIFLGFIALNLSEIKQILKK